MANHHRVRARTKTATAITYGVLSASTLFTAAALGISALNDTEESHSRIEVKEVFDPVTERVTEVEELVTPEVFTETGWFKLFGAGAFFAASVGTGVACFLDAGKANRAFGRARRDEEFVP